MNIVTPRIILRPFILEDAPFMFKWTNDVRVTQYLRFNTHKSVAESMRIISSWIEKDTFPQICNWAILKREDLEVIGSIGIGTTSVIDERGEVGYALRFDEWNKGYMSEILPYVLTFGFDNMNLHRIEATHSLLNPASGKVMKKAHMSKECPLMRHYYKSSQTGFHDSAMYVAFSDTYNRYPSEIL
ncbi:MAG: N-acetyltransferase [Spirochaetia bacterium]|nr:N-acetyltransferase [Spirochaetia bacterium]